MTLAWLLLVLTIVRHHIPTQWEWVALSAVLGGAIAHDTMWGYRFMVARRALQGVDSEYEQLLKEEGK